MKGLNALEDQNARLKRLLANAMLDDASLKDFLGQKWDALRKAAGVSGHRLLPHVDALSDSATGRSSVT